MNLPQWTSNDTVILCVFIGILVVGFGGAYLLTRRKEK